MIRLGKGKPGVCIAEGDSHHPGPPLYYANDFFWVDLIDYGKIMEFQDFDMNPKFDGVLGEQLLKPNWERQLKYLISVAGGHQIWQRNYYTRHLNCMVRHAIILGEKGQFTQWSWFDAHVKYHFYRMIAWFRNRSR